MIHKSLFQKVTQIFCTNKKFYVIFLFFTRIALLNIFRVIEHLPLLMISNYQIVCLGFGIFACIYIASVSICTFVFLTYLEGIRYIYLLTFWARELYLLICPLCEYFLISFFEIRDKIWNTKPWCVDALSKDHQPRRKWKMATFYFRKCKLDLVNFKPCGLKKKKCAQLHSLVSI